MEQREYITERKKGQHLTAEERFKIETLKKAGHKALEIATQIGSSKHTINREIARGMVMLRNSDLTERREYSAQLAQKIHGEKGSHKGPAVKMKTDLEFMEYVRTGIKADLSPYAVLQKATNEGLTFDTEICVRTLYSYIHAGWIDGVTSKNLPRRGKGQKRSYHKVRTAPKNARGTSISQRSEAIELREEFGHWEMDLVCGKQGTTAVLLALSERKTRQEIIRKLPNKEQKTIIGALDLLEKTMGVKKFRETFKTITTDNGSEFLDYLAIQRSISSEKKRTQHFFCHPYSSWERGTNENLNAMIRRKIPKGVDIGTYSRKRIAQVEAWLNDYPRRILGGLSANLAMRGIL
jgi:IS30 family transposase